MDRRQNNGSVKTVPLAIAQRQVHRAVAVSTAVLGSHKDNARCTVVEEQPEPFRTYGCRGPFKPQAVGPVSLKGSPLAAPWSCRVPGEDKRRKVELDPQVSPEEIMSKEVELGSESRTSFGSRIKQ